MPTPDSIAGDIITAASFLAGLILLYLGNLSTGFDAFSAEQQSDVRRAYRAKAWFAFGGFVVAVISVGLALASSWWNNQALLNWSMVALLLLFVAGIVSALLMVLEID